MQNSDKASSAQRPGCGAITEAAARSAADYIEQRPRQRASRVSQGLKDREVISAVDRQQMAVETAFGPGLAIIDRLAAQFGQFAGAVGDHQLPGRARQMQERAIALDLGRVETQPLVEIIEPDRL